MLYIPEVATRSMEISLVTPFEKHNSICNMIVCTRYVALRVYEYFTPEWVAKKEKKKKKNLFEITREIVTAILPPKQTFLFLSRDGGTRDKPKNVCEGG